MSVTQRITDGTILLDTGNANGLLDVAPSTTTLAAAITTTTQTAITLTSGANVVDGAYIRVDPSGTPEDMLVVSHSGGAVVVVRDPAVAATHLISVTVGLPGKLICLLLTITQLPNVEIFIRKTSADINYVAVTAGSGNTFPGGGATILLTDNDANGTAHIKFPGLGSVLLVLASGSSAQAGPPGPPGPSGGIAAPNVLSTSTASVYFEQYDGVNLKYGFQGHIDLPTSDPNYAAHFKRIEVVAVDSTGAGHLIAKFEGAAITGSSITYKGVAGIQQLAPAPDETWSVQFVPYNEGGAPTVQSSSAPTITGLTVYAAAVTSCAGSELANSHYQDRLQGLHFAIQLDVVIAHAQTPFTVSFAVDYHDGNGWTGQGPFAISGGAGSVIIGQPAAGTNEPGMIFVPAAGNGSWKVAAWPGAQPLPSSTTLPGGAVQNTFSVTPVGACSPTDLTGAAFLTNPATGDILTYALAHPGGYTWNYYQLRVTQPSLATDPWYWFSFVTIQKGHATTGTCTITGGVNLAKTGGATPFTAADVGKLIHVGGSTERTVATYVDATHLTVSAAVANGAGQAYEIWNPSADSEGVDEQPLLYHGRWTTDSGQFQGGVTSSPGTTVTFVGNSPPDWTFPLAKNVDGTVNLDRTFRCWLWCASHANDTAPGTGASPIPFVMQSPWAAGADHFDLAPADQAAALDLSNANPNSLGPGIGGGAGSPVIVKVTGPMYTDVAGNVNLRIGPDYVITGSPGSFKLSQAIVDLALAANFDTTNFKLVGGAFLIKSIAVDSLIAGNALFAGDTTFARTGGGKVTINSAGIAIADNLTTPTATVTATSSGISLAKGSNTLSLGAAGLFIVDTSNSQTLTMSSSGVTIAKGTRSVLIDSTKVKIADTTNSQSLTMDSTGVTIAKGAGSVVIGSSSLVLTSGIILTMNSSGLTVDFGSNLTIGMQSNQLFGYNGTDAAWTLTDLGAGTGTASGMLALKFGSTTQIQLGSTGFGSGVLIIGAQQVLSQRRTGPGNPSFASFSDVQTWCQNLYNALKPAGHGLLT